MNRLFPLLVSLLLLVACKDAGSGTPAETGSPAGTGAPDTGTGAITLDGATVTLDGAAYTFAKASDGYRVSGAESLEIEVEADRVKLKDASGQELAKVKKKDEGFKLYPKGSEEASLRAKRKGDGYKLLHKPDDAELGRVGSDGGEVGGDKLAIDGASVKRAGKEVASLTGTKPPWAAVGLLGVTEATPAERLAMFVFAVEVKP